MASPAPQQRSGKGKGKRPQGAVTKAKTNALSAAAVVVASIFVPVLSVKPYNLFRAIFLIIGAAVASFASQLSLTPVYGGIPTSLYHMRICDGVFMAAILGKALFRRIIPRPLALLTILAYYTPAIRLYLFRYAEEWGARKGPIMTEALTFYPQLFLAVLGASIILETRNFMSDVVPSSLLFALFKNAQAFIPGFMAQKIGSTWFFTRCGLTHLSAIIFNLFSTRLAVLAALLPGVVYNQLMNPMCSDRAAVNYLNKTLASTNYTVIARQESLTGYVSVLENTYLNFRMLRCDHSVLGGEWQKPPPGYEHAGHFKEPIYAVFVMLEAVRLIEPPPANENPKALLIGLGVGTSANGMLGHGIESDVVELDPVVYRYAQEYFGLLPNHTAYIQDAVQYVKDAAAADGPDRPVYDYIIHDVFTGGAVPPSLFTVEMLSNLKSLLALDGSIAINYAGDLKLSPAKTVIETARSVFGQCQVYREDHPKSDDLDVDFTNMVIFCTKRNKPFTFRKPLESDFLGTWSRQQFLLPTYEVNLDALLAPPQSSETTSAGERWKWPILDGSYVEEFTELQKESAVGHWKLINTVVPSKVWENY